MLKKTNKPSSSQFKQFPPHRMEDHSPISSNPCTSWNQLNRPVMTPIRRGLEVGAGISGTIAFIGLFISSASAPLVVMGSGTTCAVFLGIRLWLADCCCGKARQPDEAEEGLLEQGKKSYVTIKCCNC